MNNHRHHILLYWFFAVISHASVPTAFIFNHHPIDPVCFSNLKPGTQTVSLKQCALQSNQVIKKVPNQTIISQGYLGYEWKNTTMPDTQGYSYYRIFDAGQDRYWLSTLNGFGGSGSFSALYLVQTTSPEAFKITAIVGGDRCNGGLEHVKLSHHELSFGVHLTPFDLVHHNKLKSTVMTDSDDLARCAVCCVATAFYRITPTDKPKLHHLTLNQSNHFSDMPGQGQNQTCFNKLLKPYIASGNTHWTAQEWDTFVVTYAKKCMPS